MDVTLLESKAHARLLEGVKCPYCEAKSNKIDVGQTTTTLLYSEELASLLGIFNANTITTEYNCRSCGKRFWIDRKGILAELKEEYVFIEGSKTVRVRKV